jgi:NAD(P) transhydrogenase subunit alpha
VPRDVPDRHGHGAAHLARAKDGRAVVDGQYRRLSRGDRGANNFGRFFTGQVTAAGKVPPAKVLVVGAGVAGLAAIGAATSLGAQVYAFDVRPEVAEQIESMGAEFVYLDFDRTAQDGAATGGYAAPSSPEFREAQLKKFRELAPQMDIVITTALIPGRDAPKLWTADMVEAMKPGSRHRRPGRRARRQLRPDRAGRKDRHRKRRDHHRLYRFPLAHGAQASELYGNNIRHMLADLTPGKDGDGPEHGGRRDPRRHRHL